jgi:ribosomal protein uL22
MAYAFTGYNPERMARASLKDAAISFKKSVELSKRLRGMMSDKAERYLEAVIAKKEPVPFTRYTGGAGHRRGMMAGKYPVKAALSFLSLLKQGVANAENKGLGTPLRIIHVMAQQASRPLHHGRQRGHAMKRAHVELVLAETEESKRREKKQKRGEKREEAKQAPVVAEKPVTEKSVTEKPITKKPVTEISVTEQKMKEKVEEKKFEEKNVDEKNMIDEKKSDERVDVPEKKTVKKPAAKRADGKKKAPAPKRRPAKKE